MGELKNKLLTNTSLTLKIKTPPVECHAKNNTHIWPTNKNTHDKNNMKP